MNVRAAGRALTLAELTSLGVSPDATIHVEIEIEEDETKEWFPVVHAERDGDGGITLTVDHSIDDASRACRDLIIELAAGRGKAAMQAKTLATELGLI